MQQFLSAGYYTLLWMLPHVITGTGAHKLSIKEPVVMTWSYINYGSYCGLRVFGYWIEFKILEARNVRLLEVVKLLMKPAFCTFGYCSQYSTGCSLSRGSLAAPDPQKNLFLRVGRLETIAGADPGRVLKGAGWEGWGGGGGGGVDLSYQKVIANYSVELSWHGRHRSCWL